MEEDKAAAYYEELTRKGEGAARFKQGLGFSSKSSDTSNPSKGSAHPSSTSSFLSSFVKASSPSKSTEVSQKRIELENVQNKLKKKKNEKSESLSRVSEKRSSSIERNGDPRRRSRSRERSGNNDRERKSERRRRRSRSSEVEDDRRRRSGRENRSRRRSRSSRRLEKGRDDRRDSRTEGKRDKESNGAVDYAKLIKGYAEMTPAERVKAKTKLQLAQTVEKDTSKGMGAGWERFEFNKDAPLDEGEEMEAAEDEANLVKTAGQTFRFSAIESRREEQIKAAHDDAMFGVPTAEASTSLAELEEKEPIVEDSRKESSDSGLGANIISEKVLAKQTGSWRDRARKLKDG
ncbi:hypothetical protein C5167_006360 [Papaver somniferum]|uniref:Uncharacterized protein n=1 Tax=Papaver somniferum TaxID=3469 RepID=A0A4Y7JGB5_PAPSO|nr:hypothetical protein C5167_006360 [Papaver somniferum]